ncbi:MAG: response regulator [Myxococcaceae bacterium]
MDAITRARLLGLFVSEAEEGLAHLEGLAERLREKNVPEDLAEFAQLAHGLKGAAAAVGLADVANLLHALEDLVLRIGKTEGASRAERHRRLVHALGLFGGLLVALNTPGATQAPAETVNALRELLFEADHLAAAKLSAPAAEAPAAGARNGDFNVERLSVPAGEVDEALRLASAISRHAAALHEEVSKGAAQAPAGATLELTLASDRLETLLFNLRMLPAADALAGLDLEVERLSSRLGKEIDLSMRGQEVRADRRTLQTARWMIRHLIRNAVDHGLELPADRERAGKRRRGSLEISVAMSESQLLVQVADDGAGFDVAAIRQRLGETLGPAKVAGLSDDEVLREFAERGGSTRAAATEISGRGVGVSAVVNLARGRGGDFLLRSQPGEGSTISFNLPLEVYATEVLTMRCGARTLGLPMAFVEQTVTLGAEGVGGTLRRGPSGMFLALDERIIPFTPLSAIVGEASAPGGVGRFAVVVAAESRAVAIGVDELGVIARVVPQMVPPAVHSEALVTGLALLPDRTRLQILNPLKLMDSTRLTAVAKAAPRPRAKLKILLAEDSLATREVLRVLLEQEGYEVQVAGDGEEALGRIASGLPDAVVTDFNMPRCDGLGLIRALRASPRTAGLPVVLLTSRDDAASQEAGTAAGANAYLKKSTFNSSVLRETLRRLGVEE